jgi:uncharacterized protein (DUF1778 family)
MAQAPQRSTRPLAINIRASRQQRDLIDRAAHLLGKTRSDFMLETASRAAEAVLLDQALFLLDDDAHDRFLALLDEPPPPTNELRRLLSTRPPWE